MVQIIRLCTVKNMFFWKFYDVATCWAICIIVIISISTYTFLEKVLYLLNGLRNCLDQKYYKRSFPKGH